jgi:dihydroflavonol-4-reductase
MESLNSIENIVLVTGGSGFIGSYCVMECLKKGYTVKATLRDMKKEQMCRQSLKKAGIDENLQNKLSFFFADLVHDDGWFEALSGCTYV